MVFRRYSEPHNRHTLPGHPGSRTSDVRYDCGRDEFEMVVVGHVRLQGDRHGSRDTCSVDVDLEPRRLAALAGSAVHAHFELVQPDLVAGVAPDLDVHGRAAVEMVDVQWAAGWLGEVFIAPLHEGQQGG